MLEVLHVKSYRSLRDVYVELGPVTVVVGANGVGKSNLYNALRLLTHAARGDLSTAIAAEGGIGHPPLDRYPQLDR